MILHELELQENNVRNCFVAVRHASKEHDVFVLDKVNCCEKIDLSSFLINHSVKNDWYQYFSYCLLINAIPKISSVIPYIKKLQHMYTVCNYDVTFLYMNL